VRGHAGEAGGSGEEGPLTGGVNARDATNLRALAVWAEERGGRGDGGQSGGFGFKAQGGLRQSGAGQCDALLAPIIAQQPIVPDLKGVRP